MANRKPFDLRNVLVVYNLIQTVFSIFLFYEVRIKYVNICTNIQHLTTLELDI